MVSCTHDKVYALQLSPEGKLSEIDRFETSENVHSNPIVMPNGSVVAPAGRFLLTLRGR